MNLSHDIKYGVRVLMKSPGFVIAAVLSLALGIGANTTIFTMVNSIFLQQLPVQNLSELMYIYGTDTNNSNNIFGGFMPISYPNFRDYREQTDSFADVAAYGFPISASLAGGEKPTPIFGQLVTWNYFDVLGVRPFMGRMFLQEEDKTPGTHDVVVLNYKFWQRRGADPAAIGSTVKLNGHAFTVVGVAPNGFDGTFSVFVPDMWFPVMTFPHLTAPIASGPMDTNRRYLFYSIVGRLKPGVTQAQARATLQTVAKRLEQEYPTDNTGRSANLMPLAQATLPPAFRSVALQGSVLLMVIVGLVLLIACANIANLMMARAAARRREFTVRVALGSARSQLISQLLTESVLVALPGGLAAMAVTYFGRSLVLALMPSVINAQNINMNIDVNVLLFTMALSLFSGVLFGLMPSLRASKPDLVNELKERAGAGAPVGRFNVRNLLVFAQVALSVVALASAGLFIRSLSNSQNADLGFEHGHLVVISYDLTSNDYDPGRGKEFHRRVLEKIRAVPGVAAAALGAAAPLTPAFLRSVFPEGRETAGTDSGILVFSNNVSPGYFDTIRMPLLRGRVLDDSDREGGMLVAVINEAMAKRFWPGEDAVGKRFKFFGDKEYRTVVGIVKTSKYASVGEDPQSAAYTALDQYYQPVMTLHARVGVTPESIKGTLERELRGLDRDVALGVILTGPELLNTSLWAPRLAATLLGIFGVIALMLAAVGIYGVMSYSVSQRAPEIGIRMALGAQRGEVMRMVLRQGMTIVSLGIASGLVLAILVSAGLKRLLYGVGTGDFITLAGTTITLLLVALLANYIPARRATAVDPVTVMRYE